jgi:hypothetical protein
MTWASQTLLTVSKIHRNCVITAEAQTFMWKIRWSTDDMASQRLWYDIGAFTVLTMKFTTFNINKNQVPANISWTYQTKIFHKKW